ncbi:TerD family protein [Actinomycetes bacterium M1A6_2h]
MTLRLTPGQNAGLTDLAVTATVRAASVDVCALLVDGNRRARADSDFVFWNSPTAAGVRLADNGSLELTLDEIEATVDAVLVVVSADGSSSLPADVGLELAGPSSEVLYEFAPSTAGLGALIGLEFYRRGNGWKVRAVGQGFAGGLADLLVAHGVEVDTPTTQHDSAVQTVPLDRSRVLERVWMIFEDASRSAAAFDAAVDYADERLGDELSTLSADASTRSSPAAERERTDAQNRHDALVATAQARHLDDSRVLTDEISTLDRELPPSVATWGSAAWQHLSTAEYSDCIRVGDVTVPSRSPLRVPLCAAWPAANPLWFEDDTGGVASSPAVTAALLRIAAAAPRGSTVIDILDIGGSLTQTSARLSPIARSLTDRSAVTARLDELAHSIDLWHMAVGAGETPPTLPPRSAVVVSGFPYGFGSAELGRIAFLAERGPFAGLSLVLVGSADAEDVDPLAAALLRRSMHLPVDGRSPVHDPWVGGEWAYEPDIAPADTTTVDRVVSQLSGAAEK